MTAKVVSLQVRPGIQRDGTQFASPSYIDGQWVRFQNGLPKKMGGYNGIFLNASGISRGMYMSSLNGLNYVVSGYSDNIEQWVTSNQQGLGSGPTSFTLANFTISADNLWQFEIGYDSNGGGNNKLIAHPGQNLTNIDSTVNTRPLVGNFTSTTMSGVGIFTAVGNTTSGSATVTFASTVIAIGAGLSVTGTGIQSDTTVVSASTVSGTWTVILSKTATATGTPTLTFDNNISVSGGVVMLHPYLFVYGNNGLIQNCAAGDFSNWTSADANTNNVSTGKVVKGLPLRGGTTSPSGLFWTLDSVVRVSYSPSTVNGINYYWRYDLLTSQSSIMSSQCVIEYDGIFYWAGVDRFLMYNGAVQEIPNNQNQNYFFDNLNYTQRQKVWCAKIPRWGEIWWFYPKGNATECTDAIIYNVREKTWYDAGQAPGAQRSAGTYTEVFHYPIMGGTQQNTAGKYTLWQHEIGTDQIYTNQVDAINSYFETPALGSTVGLVGSTQQPGDNVWTRCERIEPDFVQTGEMTVTVTGKGYADDADIVSAPYTFNNNTLKVDMREQRRELRLRFGSNTVGGNYFMGKVLCSLDTGDTRSTANPS
jgi:hypothetical protein